MNRQSQWVAESSDDISQPHLDGLDALFAPESIAVIGASADDRKIGGKPMRLLQRSGYEGATFPINPGRDHVLGTPAYASLDDVKQRIDLAVIALPSDAVLPALLSCVENGVRAAVIFSSGFAEAGESGARDQGSVAQIASESGIRVLGPNCLGIASRRSGLMASFASVLDMSMGQSIARRVGFVSQSGAVGSHCLTLALNRGLDFDPWVSTGNESDIDFADCLGYLALDDDVDVIAGYMEGCSDGMKLRKSLRMARERNKPVIILKVGRTDVGARAVASHTASMVGSDEMFETLFREFSVCRVDSLTELVDLSYALSFGGSPKSDRVALVSASGGVGILMADAASTRGLSLPTPCEHSQQKLMEIIPSAGLSNPIDMTAGIASKPELVGNFLVALLQDNDYDVTIVFLSYLGIVESLADELIDTLKSVREVYTDGLLIVSMLTTESRRRVLEDLGVLVLEDPSAAVAIASLVIQNARGEIKKQVHGIRPASSCEVASLNEFALDEVDSKDLLRSARIAVARERLVSSCDDAVEAATSIGFPVTLKLVAAQIPHKSDIGGVVLGVNSEADVVAAFDSILANVRLYRPDVSVRGVLVSEFIEGGVETVIGVTNEGSFGPLVMFGLGGVGVEVLRDVSYRFAPFDVAEATKMIREIKGFALLDGFRGKSPCDLDALAQSLSRLSLLAIRYRGSIASIDVNPLLVLPRGKGVVAVDALVERV